MIPFVLSQMCFENLPDVILCRFGKNMFVFVLTKTSRTCGKEDRGVACRNGGVKASTVEGKSLLPSAVQRKLNPNNFIEIIASE